MLKNSSFSITIFTRFSIDFLYIFQYCFNRFEIPWGKRETSKIVLPSRRNANPARCRHEKIQQNHVKIIMIFNIYFWLDFVTILVRFWNPKSIIETFFKCFFETETQLEQKSKKKQKISKDCWKKPSKCLSRASRSEKAPPRLRS